MFKFESPLGNLFNTVPTQRTRLPGVRLLALLGTLLVTGFLVWVLPVYAKDISGDGNAVTDEALIWSADMTVVEYTGVSIGAASADLFSNIGGSAGLQIKSLWSHTPDRDLRLAFKEGIPDAEDYTLQVGDLSWSDNDSVTARLTYSPPSFVPCRGEDCVEILLSSGLVPSGLSAAPPSGCCSSPLPPATPPPANRCRKIGI